MDKTGKRAPERVGGTVALHLTDANFEEEVVNASQPVLVDFWAPWCGPCRSMGPIIDDLENEFSGQVKIAKVNVDDNHSVAAKFGVMSIPTLIFFKKGTVVGQVVGYTPKAVLAKKLENLLEG